VGVCSFPLVVVALFQPCTQKVSAPTKNKARKNCIASVVLPLTRGFRPSVGAMQANRCLVIPLVVLRFKTVTRRFVHSEESGCS
jgi:hypothetical protein